MLKHFTFFVTIIILTSCGLNYIPPPTMENLVSKRKEKVESFISTEYASTGFKYNSLLFGETSVVKPLNYKLLDSLYTVKYSNENLGVFEPDLEEKIGNQKQIIQRDTAKVIYIEHHVYAITDSINSEISFADVSLDPQLNVTEFKITEQHTIPKDLLSQYEDYLTSESIMNPGYLASSAEHNLYQFYKEHYNVLPFAEQEEFLVHTLKVFHLARKLKSVDTELLLRVLGIKHVFNRGYDKTIDNYTSIDGLFQNNELIGYTANLESGGEKYIVKFTPYLELEIIQKLDN